MVATEADLIQHSVTAYRRRHRHYEDQHGEIFNEVEQQRLAKELGKALAATRSAASPPHALDLGCGSGNLTRHLVDLGAEVTAADVSPHFLDGIGKHYERRGSRVNTMLLNGVDLRELESGSLDFIGTYSVLHHVPDYLALVADCMRVLRPGGVLYVDHEVNENYWHPPKELARFRDAVSADTPRKSWRRFLEPSRYLSRLRSLTSPRYQLEGDIHVWPDDHIEWDRIEEQLRDAGADVVQRDNYLLFRREYASDTYWRYATICSDMARIVARKGEASR